MPKEVVVRFAVSSLVTFLEAFVIVFTPALDENFTIKSLTDGTFVALLFTAARLGVKMVLEQLLPLVQK